jgi:ribulose-phosphate 3-epimerase
MIEVIPGILEKEWEMIEERLRLVTGLVDWVQLDFADNTLVPNTTFLDFSRFTRHASARLPKTGTVGQASVAGGPQLEAHFMVANPEKYIKAAVDAGFKRVIAQVEAHDPRLFLDAAKHEEVEVGIAIDGPTEFEAVEPFLEEVDFVLVMMVEAGFSGGTFLPECLEKIKSIHSYLPDLPIEADGGISDKTARLVTEAGATRLVSTSFLFRDPANIAGAIDRLKSV